MESIESISLAPLGFLTLSIHKQGLLEKQMQIYGVYAIGLCLGMKNSKNGQSCC